MADLENKLTVKSDRVALLESEMQIPDAKNYKTALEDAFDKCSVAIDGDDRWEYPGQMIRAVESVVAERDAARGKVAELEDMISKLLFSPIDGTRTVAVRVDYAREAHELIGPGKEPEAAPKAD